MEGRCTCGEIRYRLTDRPLFTHCCHCTWCQRETGSAFVLNAMIESACIEVHHGATEAVLTPSASGKGQVIHRCPRCRVALWSHYAGAGELIAFVRVGTLEEAAKLPPDIHIFTETRLPWVVIPEGVPVMKEFYRRSEQWPDWAIARRDKALAHRM